MTAITQELRVGAALLSRSQADVQADVQAGQQQAWQRQMEQALLAGLALTPSSGPRADGAAAAASAGRERSAAEHEDGGRRARHPAGAAQDPAQAQAQGGAAVPAPAPAPAPVAAADAGAAMALRHGAAPAPAASPSRGLGVPGLVGLGQGLADRAAPPFQFSLAAGALPLQAAIGAAAAPDVAQKNLALAPLGGLRLRLAPAAAQAQSSPAPERPAPEHPANGEPWQKQHLHLYSEGDQVALWIRDAAIDPQRVQALIARLSGELGDAGLQLRSATVNGRAAYGAEDDGEGGTSGSAQREHADAAAQAGAAPAVGQGGQHGR